MELYPLVPPDLPRPVESGWARSIRRGPRTLDEVLASARAEMDEQDRREEMERDPIAYVRAHRPSRLLDRLLGR